MNEVQARVQQQEAIAEERKRREEEQKQTSSKRPRLAPGPVPAANQAIFASIQSLLWLIRSFDTKLIRLFISTSWLNAVVGFRGDIAGIAADTDRVA